MDCLIARFFLAKTSLGDVCEQYAAQDRSQRFSKLLVWYAASLSIAPLVGAATMELGDGVSTTFPALVPFLTLATLLIIVLKLCWTYFQETHPYLPIARDPNDIQSSPKANGRLKEDRPKMIRQHNDNRELQHQCRTKSLSLTMRSSVMEASNDVEDGFAKTWMEMSRDDSPGDNDDDNREEMVKENTEMRMSRRQSQEHNDTTWTILTQRDVMICLIIHGVFVWSLNASEILLPLFTIESIEFNGLGLDSYWIAIFFAFEFASYGLAQVLLYPRISKYFNPVHCFRMGLIALSFIHIAGYSPSFVATTSSYSRQLMMALVLILRMIAVSMALTSSFVCIDSTSNANTKATINGATQAISSLGRGTGTMIGGLLYDAGRSIHFIFLPFLIIGIVTFCVGFAAWILIPPSLAQKKTLQQ